MIHAMTPRVFNIPASAPFLRTLFDALLAGKLVEGFPGKGDPLALAQATLYLPTRRACRLAREVFLDASGGDAAILPRIAAIGDIDEDELIFAAEGTGDLAAPALELPATIAPLERRLLLAELIAKWGTSARLRGALGTPLVANTPASALALADDAGAADGRHDDARDRLGQARQVGARRARRVLAIVTRLPEDRADRLAGHPERAQPDRARNAARPADRSRDAATCDFHRAGDRRRLDRLDAGDGQIAGHHRRASLWRRRAAGLDTDLDEPSWRGIAGSGDDNLPAAGHPQFAMQALLARMGIARPAVKTLGAAGPREAFVSEAMRPASTTELWRKRLETGDFSTLAGRAMDGLAIVAAANAEEEALAVAVALREAAETPGKTAALITPDRALARRVLASLARWNVEVDDSGGDALADTPAGLFARLTLEAALGGVAPVALLALLKHPLFHLGAKADDNSRAIAALERAVLRGPRPKRGTPGLILALDSYKAARKDRHRNDPQRRVSDADLAAAQSLVANLAKVFAPLESLRSDVTLNKIAAHHRAVVMALSQDAKGAATAARGPDGTRLDTLFDDLIADTPAAKQTVIADDGLSRNVRGHFRRGGDRPNA